MATPRRDDDARATTAPRGFVRITVGKATAVCVAPVADALAAILERTTLYDFAQTHPAARPMAGRGTSR